jgi:uncharacterized protein YjlB
MIQTLHFRLGNPSPNNPDLPVLVYRQVFVRKGDVATAMEARFERNGWPPQWRNGIYAFHHYHRTAHEVLGIASGEVTVMLGGNGGATVVLRQGDAVLLPAGTGHCRISQSEDLVVIGAYPPRQYGDIERAPATPQERAIIASVPHPGTDPVGDIEGVPQYWQHIPDMSVGRTAG